MTTTTSTTQDTETGSEKRYIGKTTTETHARKIRAQKGKFPTNKKRCAGADARRIPVRSGCEKRCRFSRRRCVSNSRRWFRTYTFFFNFSVNCGMQFQPLVESSPIHQQQHRNSNHQDDIRLVRRPHSLGLGRLRSVVRNVAQTFHHPHHHHSVDSDSISAGQAASSMSAHHHHSHHQMGRLRKLAATSILGRFRSGSKTTSDDDEAPTTARGGAASHDGRLKAEPDPALDGSCGPSTSGLTSPSFFSSSQSNDGGQVNRAKKR